MQQTLFAGAENNPSPSSKAHFIGIMRITVWAPYDEMFASDGSVRGHYAELYERVFPPIYPIELRRRQQACEQLLLASRHHLHRLWRQPIDGTDHPDRPAAAHHHGGRVDATRSRAEAAHPSAQPVSL
jgi:hypothetical protein